MKHLANLFYVDTILIPFSENPKKNMKGKDILIN